MRRNMYFILLGLLLITVSNAQVPREISFQGKLAGVSSPVNLTFRIFDDAAAGVELWSESHLGTVLDGDGLFNVILGQTTPIDLDFVEDYWIEILVGGTPLLNRYKLTTDAYSFRAIYADTADWYGITGMPAGFADGIDDEGIGVHDHWGESWSGSGTGLGLTSSDAVGLSAITSASTPGVRAAVYGLSDAASGAALGILGRVENHNAPGVSGQWGASILAANFPVGVFGRSEGGHGVYGRTEYSGAAGIYGTTSGAGTYAGYFDGDVHIMDGQLKVEGSGVHLGGLIQLYHLGLWTWQIYAYDNFLNFHSATTGAPCLVINGDNGNVGIGPGLVDPAYQLEVDGDVHITGEFTSETPSYVQVPSYAMRPRDNTTMDYSISSSNGDIYNNGASTLYLYGAVNIPHGATVQEITFYWYDDCASGTTAWLYRRDHTGTSTSMVNATSLSGGYGSTTDATITDPVIDLQNYRYYIYCSIVGSEGTDLRYSSVVIEYVK